VNSIKKGSSSCVYYCKGRSKRPDHTSDTKILKEVCKLEEENTHLQDKLTISKAEEGALENELEQSLAESRICKSWLHVCYNKIQCLSATALVASEMNPHQGTCDNTFIPGREQIK
jgi:hypothetical protein